MKLWSGRFKKETHKLVDEYNASIKFDYKLAEFDILGSLAHVKMLGKCNILAPDIVNSITEGLQRIQKKIEASEVKFNDEDEDIHMNIEKLLHQLIGNTAGYLHTGRSRNDQVALDMHLYLRYQILKIIENIYDFENVVVKMAKENVDTIMPGYTHLQRAEPVRFAHHVLAYFHMFYRDYQRLCDTFTRANICPLGAGALAGSGIKIDRNYVATLLNFDSIYENSMDAVSDRDFIVEFLSNVSLIMMHLSKLSEEIILWSSQEFSFIQLDEEFCTGSSMMPQKRNPDVAELARGKTGRVYGSLMGLLIVLKGLPLAYNKDMQEDKEGLFDAVNTIKQTLSVYSPMLASIKINKEIMNKAAINDYSNATQLANYLVDKEIPFRKAHEITGNIVLYCIDNNIFLGQLPLEKYQSFCPKIFSDVYSHIEIQQVIEAHDVEGGTAKKSIMLQIQQAESKLNQIKTWLDEKSNLIHFNDNLHVL